MVLNKLKYYLSPFHIDKDFMCIFWNSDGVCVVGINVNHIIDRSLLYLLNASNIHVTHLVAMAKYNVWIVLELRHDYVVELWFFKPPWEKKFAWIIRRSKKPGVKSWCLIGEGMFFRFGLNNWEFKKLRIWQTGLILLLCTMYFLKFQW